MKLLTVATLILSLACPSAVLGDAIEDYELELKQRDQQARQESYQQETLRQMREQTEIMQQQLDQQRSYDNRFPGPGDYGHPTYRGR